ncbi:translesion error-prone DNA polymerase V autoproteolytic subunit [Dyadobacter sp. LJ53]|uniref:LexA family protein n=1 Tax=Dyadobacter chenwenxiniae TaxID=2906456 RepID=UPI001F21AB1E|nr:translesion error-prone DNA polymerase V autoproteolytic subunit [Dyadobacter chenwenxiniae]MCF0049569.1 translesion error-prone DNA polymerase V autoproteolytic subunit [Dyadobacter chenwenxiniae]
MTHTTDPHSQSIRFVSSCVSAGFPSPADDYLDSDLNLHDFLVKKPAATFLVRARGKSMSGIGIFDNDVLVVDRSEKAIDRSVIIACVNGECLVKRLRIVPTAVWLEAAHHNYPPIHIRENLNFSIWGVVIGVVRKHWENGRVRFD